MVPAGGGSPLDQLHRSSPAVTELPVRTFRQGLWNWQVCQGTTHAARLGWCPGKPLWSPKGVQLPGDQTPSTMWHRVAASAAHWGVAEHPMPWRAKHLCSALGSLQPVVPMGGLVPRPGWHTTAAHEGLGQAVGFGGSLGCSPGPWHTLPVTDELRAVAGPGGRERGGQPGQEARDWQCLPHGQR